VFNQVNFSIVQGTNVTLVYTIDSYRPVAGEITVAQLGFKCEWPSTLLTWMNRADP
jgi:hypothetical protein